MFSYAHGPTTDQRGTKAGRANDNPEARLQKSVVEYLTFALPPDILWTATLNGIPMTMNARNKAKAQGLRPGIADIVLVIPGRGARMLELKSDAGRLSAEQKDWAAAMRSWWVTARDLETVEAALRGWGIVPRYPISQANRYAVPGAS